MNNFRNSTRGNSVWRRVSRSLGQARCPPLVCVEGQPTLACLTLLSLLSHLGYGLKYHGDFDWGGLRIAHRVYETIGFESWRFSTADYQVTSEHHRKLRPPATEASWDQNLAAIVNAGGVAIEEEAVIEILIGDLSDCLS